MTKRIAKRVKRPLSDDDRKKYDKIRKEIESEKPELLRRGRALKAEFESRRAEGES